MEESNLTQRIVVHSPRKVCLPSAGETADLTLRIRHALPVESPPSSAGLGSETLGFSLVCVSDSVPDTLPVQMEYSVDAEIARGGMGKIYAARDPLLKREVAVKLSTGDQTQEDRFTLEAKVLAALEHPNIVPIHNLGFDVEGRPFYSMKLVQGRTLQEILAQHPKGDAQYPLPRLLEIFRRVCDAMAFAHSKGYLHRDLKPGNIMVGEFGEVLVMDWGLAKVLRPSLPEPDTLTYLDGTPLYMSPEQAEGLYAGLDERSDIYSLGGILHAILTRQAPVEGSSVHEVLEKVRTGLLSPMPLCVPAALRAITLKALARDRDARYQSVRALAQDIEAYQNGFATTAEKATAIREFALFVKRHRAASALTMLLLCSAAVFTVRLALSEKQARLMTQLAEEKTREAIREKEATRHEAAQANLARAESYERKCNAEEMQDALERVPEDLRSQQWRYLNALLDTSEKTILAKNDSNWTACLPHPAAPGVLITLQEDQWVRTVDLHTGESVDLFQLPHPCDTRSLAVSGDGKKLALTRTLQKPKGPEVTLIEVYSLPEGHSLFSCETPYVRDCWLRFNAEGTGLLKISRRGWAPHSGLLLMDLEKGGIVWKREQIDGVYDATFHGSDGLLFASKAGLQQLDPTTGAVQRFIGPLNLMNYAPMFSEGELLLYRPDGIRPIDEHGATRYETHFLTKTGSEPETERFDLHCLPKEKLLVKFSRVAEKSALLEVRDLATGDLMVAVPILLDRNKGSTWIAAASPATSQVVVLRGNRMKVWKVARATPAFTKQDPFAPEDAVTFLSQSNQLLQVSASQKKGTRSLEIHTWNAGALTFTKTLPEPLPEGFSDFYAKSSRDGRVLATAVSAAPSWRLRIYNTRLLEEKRDDQFPGTWRHFSLNPDGTLIWTATGFYDVRAGVLNKCQIRNIELLPNNNAWTDNTHLACIAVVKKAKDEEAEKGIVLFDALKASVKDWVPAASARKLASNAEGRLLAEGGTDQKVRIRDAATLKELKTLRVHDAPVVDLAWHPKLPYLATIGEDLRLRIWDVSTERLVEEIGLMAEAPRALQWGDEGRVLLVRGQRTQFFFTPKATQ
jgi:hypothetical protein